MMRFKSMAFTLAFLASPAMALAGSNVEVTLSGSRASMLRQNRIAKKEDFSFLRTPTQVHRFVDGGHLVPLSGNAHYAVVAASYPFARPVVRAFVERLAEGYSDACGERLVVTSLTRPVTRQPRNASPLSVHPAGMAVDLRVSDRSACRSWLSSELLRLEERGLLDATLEHRPPHYHVAVFPAEYSAYEQTVQGEDAAAEAVRLLEAAVAARAAAEAAMAPPVAVAVAEPEVEAVADPVPFVVRIAALLARVILPLPV